jgi:hypothetical protein
MEPDRLSIYRYALRFPDFLFRTPKQFWKSYKENAKVRSPKGLNQVGIVLFLSSIEPHEYLHRNPRQCFQVFENWIKNPDNLYRRQLAFFFPEIAMEKLKTSVGNKDDTLISQELTFIETGFKKFMKDVGSQLTAEVNWVKFCQNNIDSLIFKDFTEYQWHWLLHGDYAVFESNIANAGKGLFFKGEGPNGEGELDLRTHSSTEMPLGDQPKCMSMTLTKNVTLYCKDTELNKAWFIQGVCKDNFVPSRVHKNTNLSRGRDMRLPYKKPLQPLQIQTHKFQKSGILKNIAKIRPGQELYVALGRSFIRHVRGEVSEVDWGIERITDIDYRKGIVFAEMTNHSGTMHPFKISDVEHLPKFRNFIKKTQSSD